MFVWGIHATLQQGSASAASMLQTACVPVPTHSLAGGDSRRSACQLLLFQAIHTIVCSMHMQTDKGGRSSAIPNILIIFVLQQKDLCQTKQDSNKLYLQLIYPTGLKCDGCCSSNHRRQLAA